MCSTSFWKFQIGKNAATKKLELNEFSKKKKKKKKDLYSTTILRIFFYFQELFIKFPNQ